LFASPSDEDQLQISCQAYYTDSEQAGRRPVIVLSHTRYNEKTGLAVFCPITSKAKGYPFELAVPTGLPVGGVVLCDHLRSEDWKERRWQPLCKVPLKFVHEVMARTMTLFEVVG